MRMTLIRRFTGSRSQSVSGELTAPGFAAMSCEREWLDNTPGKSCVPLGFYVLEPHDGVKYKQTFALIGETVSHSQQSGVQRYACVIHWSATGAGLQGCVSVGDATEIRAGKGPRLVGSRVTELLAMLREEPGPHYMTIEEG